MPFDYIRRLYSSRMILHRDGPEVEGRWVWSPDGVNPVGVPTAFSSSSWDTRDQWDSPTAVGEVRSSVAWTRPHLLNPRLTGQHVCGTPEVLLGNATAADVGTPAVDAEGVPICCDPREWIGGSWAGGEGYVYNHLPGAVDGGIALGGDVP